MNDLLDKAVGVGFGFVLLLCLAAAAMLSLLIITYSAWGMLWMFEAALG